MSSEDVLSELLSMTKPYTHIKMRQGTFWNTVKAIRNCTARKSTVITFMSKFGYSIKEEKLSWEKK